MNKRPAGVYPLFTLIHTSRNFSLYLLTFSPSLSSFLFFFFLSNICCYYSSSYFCEQRFDQTITFKCTLKEITIYFPIFISLLCIFVDYKIQWKMKLIVFPFLIKNLNLFFVQIVLCDVLCISWINDTRDHLLECIYFVCFPFCIYFVYSPFSFVYFFVTIRWRVEKK